MTDQFDVSVVMSVYNGEGHLAESIDSILSQEGVSLEFIIVDDGSTDRSGEILREYGRRDDRVRILSQGNQGLTRALIAGCAAARGQYIARQDVGDISYPDKLSLQKSALDADQTLAFVSCWTEFCGPQQEFLYLVKGTGLAAGPVNIIAAHLEHGLIDAPTCHGSVLFRANTYHAAGGYRAQFYYGQDNDLWYRLAEIGNFRMIQKTLYRARVMPNSVSSGNTRDQEALARLSRQALTLRLEGKSDKRALDAAEFVRPRGKRRVGNRAHSKGFYFIAECLRRNGDDRSLGYFMKSLRANPLALKAWLRLIQNSVMGPHGLPGAARE